MISDYYEDVENDSTPKLRPVAKKNRFQVSVVPDRLPPRVYECFKRHVCPILPIPIVPITHIDQYIRDMGLTGQAEELYRRLYTPPPDEVVVKKEKFILPSEDLLHVFTNLKVLKNGMVKIKFTVPMEPVYVYQMKHKLAPIDIRVRAANGFGYPDTVLTKMIMNNDVKKANIPKLDSFIDNIFGKCISTKANKPKSKTVQENLNSKFKKKPAKKYS